MTCTTRTWGVVTESDAEWSSQNFARLWNRQPAGPLCLNVNLRRNHACVF